MTGLKLKLSPNEQLLINGAVLQNGKRATELIVKSKNTHILRLKDAMHPKDVNTEVKKVFYIVQLAVAGEAKAESVVAETTVLLEGLKKNLFKNNIEGTQLINDIQALIREHNFYKANKSLKDLITKEEVLLGSKESNDSLK